MRKDFDLNPGLSQHLSLAIVVVLPIQDDDVPDARDLRCARAHAAGRKRRYECGPGRIEQRLPGIAECLDFTVGGDVLVLQAAVMTPADNFLAPNTTAPMGMPPSASPSRACPTASSIASLKYFSIRTLCDTG